MKCILRSLLRFGEILAIAFAVLVPAALFAQAQHKDNQGKEFYVAFAQNDGSGSEILNFFALFITSAVATQGTVEVPGINFSQAFTTTPGTITTIELPSGKNRDPLLADRMTPNPNYDPNDPSVEIASDEQALPGMAVHIISNDNIAVYGMNHKQWSSDAFMALPIGVLGTEYRTLNYQTSTNDGNQPTPGEFWIAGIIDSTNITITPKAATANGSPPGAPFKVLLNKGDAYMVQGDVTDEFNDLTGSLIESDQAIAVFSGHVRADIPHGYKDRDRGIASRDHLCEQLPPVSAWGDSALVVRYQTASLPDLVRVVSSEDDNVVKVNGNVVATLKAGDFYEWGQLTTPISIQATSPILVGQYMHTSLNADLNLAYGDPAYALIFPVEQFDTSYTFMLDQNPAAFSANYVNIVTDPAGVSTMQIDGKAVTPANFPGFTTFQPIPGSNYVYAAIKLAQGEHHIFSSKHFGITLYALGPVDSYAYPGGSLLRTITPFKTVDVVIDFGDRVMTATGPGPTYDTVGRPIGTNKWDTTVYLQNISSDPYTINGFTNRGGNGFTDFDVNRFPQTIAPSALDSITIEFNTTQPYVELNTTIQALTPHLQAYVVQVKGRGILVNAEMYSDSNTTLPIDTLDFGVMQAIDKPKDSFVYVANKGTVDLTIDSDGIAGPNAGDFSIQLPRSIKSKIVTPPYKLHPYSNVLAFGDSSAKVPLRFTPTALANGFYQAEYDIHTNGQQRKVILLAHVKTILQSSVTPAVFDTVFLCLDETKSFFIDNPNPDFPVTVTSFHVSGPDSADFLVTTPMPLVIGQGSRGQIDVQFIPDLNTGSGPRIGTVTITFDLPKGFTKTFPLSAFADQLSSSFWARTNIHILPGEATMFPIYARSPMQQFASQTFQLEVWYDTTYIIDDPSGYIQDNTLTSNGYYSVNNDSAGYSVYSYATFDGSFVSGGSDTTQMPLVYLKFKSHLATGANPVHFHTDIDINYRITFDHSPVPPGCILSLAPIGIITMDSTCETVYLLQDTFLYPSATYIVPVRPNPVSTYAKFAFDVPGVKLTANSLQLKAAEDVPVRLDIIDMIGTTVATVLDETKKPGTYEVVWNATAIRNGSYYVRLFAAGKAMMQKIVVQH